MQGDYEKALSSYQKEQSIAEKISPEDYPLLARMYKHMGNYTDALLFLGKSLTIRKRMFLADHPSTRLSCNNIGMTHYSMGNYVTARSYFEEALSIIERSPSFRHSSVEYIKK